MRRLLILALVLGWPALALAQGPDIEYFKPFVTTSGGGAAFDEICLDVTNQDTCLKRDAANTLALRNSTNAETFRWYNTYTNSSNGEWGFLKWDTNIAVIGTDANGTGSNRAMALQAKNGNIFMGSSAAYYVNIASAGIFGGADDTYSIGTSNRLWTDAYIARATQGSKTITLTESSATTVFTIALADKAVTAGEVYWSVHAADATNTQMVSNTMGFDCLNEADTEACTINNLGTDTDNTPTGTLTCTDAWSYGTNNASFTLNCVSSLTQTTLNAYVRLNLLVSQTVTWP